MAYTIDDITIRVQRQFGDESGVQVTSDDVVRWVADAFREVNTQNSGPKTKFADVAVVVNQQDYVAAPDINDILSVSYRPDSLSAFYELEFMSVAEMNDGVSGWNSTIQPYASGDPVIYTRSMTGYRSTIALYPIPDTAGGTMRIVYNALLTPPATSNLDLAAYIHESYFNYLLEYCLMKSYEMDENWEAADRKAQYIQSTLNLLSAKDNYLNNSTYPVISVRVGDTE